MKLLQELVRIKSLSGQEGKLAYFIVEYLAKKGIRAQKEDGNVIIHTRGTNPHKALIFNAHMDTVKTELTDWIHPPFGKGAGVISDGKLYGLGASDDKGAIAAMIILICCQTKPPPLDLWFTFVTEEETDGTGTEKFLKWFKKGKYINSYKKISAIIGEPTDLKQVEIGHRGNIFLKLKTSGISGHAALKYDKGQLAIDRTREVLDRLELKFQKWGIKYRHDTLGFPGMNITSIRTEEGSVNSIPKVCEAVLDIRTTPTLHEKLIAMIGKAVGPGIGISEIGAGKPPAYISGKSSLVKTILNAEPGLKSGISLGTTDMSQFVQAGIEAVVLGPGEKSVIHKANEYIEIAKAAGCVKIYERIITALGEDK